MININRKDLRRMYWKEEMSLLNIGKKIGKAESTIHRYMKKYNIPRRKIEEAKKKPFDREQLVYLYLNKNLSSGEIGEQFGMSKVAVLYWLEKYRIPKRKFTYSNKVKNAQQKASQLLKGRAGWRKGQTKVKFTREQLNDLYWTQNLTLKQIGSLCGANTQTISNLMRNFGISIREKYKFKSGKENLMFGKKRQDLSERNRNTDVSGKNNPMYGKKHKPSSISLMSMKHAQAKYLYKNTSIERKIQKELDKLRIKYKKHVPILMPKYSGQFDLVIPEKRIVIECDGCYWHGCSMCVDKFPKDINRIRERDINQNLWLQQNGWNVLRFWEHDINDNIESVMEIIKKNVT